MRLFEFLPHSADIRVRVQADSLQELFRGALDALNEVLKKGFGKDVRPSIREEFALSASDTTSLLIDFLSEVLTRSYERRVIFCKVDFLELSRTNLRATIAGSPVDGFDEDIKAITYHEAEITKNERGEFETVLVFDI